ncbi:hypothetical protein [Scytonema sp. HK-05]|uniref:hypothetical protein n=1 Tax=Scytonema sp. HK-05 TaxID=1137095 RepID=UPI0013017410|nr:hypothetical protein [Scytonema sp. HK-05]
MRYALFGIAVYQRCELPKAAVLSPRARSATEAACPQDLRYRANVKDPRQQISFNVDYLVSSFVGRTITGTKLLTKPVIATITEAIPPIDNEIKIATERMISVGLYPSRIQVDGFSTDVGEAGINCEVWVV